MDILKKPEIKQFLKLCVSLFIFIFYIFIFSNNFSKKILEKVFRTFTDKLKINLLYVMHFVYNTSLINFKSFEIFQTD